jgi:arylsulfatase A-like enzyme
MYYHQSNIYPYIGMSERDHKIIRAAYYAMIDLIDVQVGKLVEALERTNQLDNTLIIFTSDHGEMLGDHGIYMKGPFFYEPAIRVPLIMAGYGVNVQGVVSDALVELVDLAPTLLELTGVQGSKGIQGKSLGGIVGGADDRDRHREDIYCEYYNARSDHREYATMVRTRQHKLVAVHGTEEGELYDLETDPGEFRNLWYARPDLKLDLLKRLCDRMAWTVDPLPEKNGLF